MMWKVCADHKKATEKFCPDAGENFSDEMTYSIFIGRVLWKKSSDKKEISSLVKRWRCYARLYRDGPNLTHGCFAFLSILEQIFFCFTDRYGKVCFLGQLEALLEDVNREGLQSRYFYFLSLRGTFPY